MRFILSVLPVAAINLSCFSTRGVISYWIGFTFSKKQTLIHWSKKSSVIDYWLVFDERMSLWWLQSTRKNAIENEHQFGRKWNKSWRRNKLFFWTLITKILPVNVCSYKVAFKCLLGIPHHRLSSSYSWLFSRQWKEAM